MSSFINWLNELADRFRLENAGRRREDRDLETTIEENEALNFPEDGGAVRAISVDFKAKENAANHNCEKFELVTRGEGTPIIRRGGNCSIEVKINQDVDLKNKQNLTLYFNFGRSPRPQNGTQAVLNVTGKKFFDKKHGEWDIRVEGQEKNVARLEIQVPEAAPVGIWNTAVEVSLRGSPPDSTRKHTLSVDKDLYILFNPWNKYDTVYLSDKEKREEYVLNDVGKIWVGNYPTARGRHWVFGQFDDAVLPACILLVEKSGLRPDARGDPIRVSRAISRIANTNDDNGVVFGRWDGKYDDGTEPSAWTGSIAILEEYMKTQRGVRYGQCWVFSGVVTTVCRAIGIPCRSVSNFNSAHDTNVSLSIDEYIDKSGKKIEDWRPDGPNPSGLSDSIWNFHVWNDVWMTRPDLPEGYGGWQAIDSTPQETSEGVFQCGPASHEAIQRGQTELKYDVAFVFSEVNADLIYWQEDENEPGGFKKLSANMTHIGRELVTKKIGPLDDDLFTMKDREDCTGVYKPREGSRAERAILNAAARRYSAARLAYRLPSTAEEDVEFSIEDIEKVQIGEDFKITLKIKNKAESARTVTVVMSASSEYYTGVQANDITRAEGQFVVQASEERTLQLPVSYQEYFRKLVEHGMIKILTVATVKETSQTWVGDDKFQVIKPGVTVTTPEEAVVMKTMRVKFNFTNPLESSLRNCYLMVDGPGITRPKRVEVRNVPPKAEMKHEMDFIPKKNGSLHLVATFNSDQLVDITGCSTVKVVDP